ncbi:MAG: hypothetical protein ACR2MG_19605 [Pyrinomonadaceae bacterium]
MLAFLFCRMEKPNANQTLAPHIALVAVQLFFGSAAVLGKAALQTLPSYAIVGFRVSGATGAKFLQTFK